MHALLAHLYHLALHAIQISARPAWRSMGVCLGVVVVARLAGLARRPGGAALVAGSAVLAGWACEAPPLQWPPPPIARLSGLALIIMAGVAAGGRGKRTWLLPVIAAACAWWLYGAPMAAAAVAGCIPVFFGFWAGFALCRRSAEPDRGWATLAAACGLAFSLLATGASPHWASAAGVAAMAALGFLGTVAAVPTLTGLIVAVSIAALVASDRGRLAQVDVACLAPWLAWGLVPRLQRRAGRYGAALACVAVAALCVWLTWASGFAAALR